MKPAAAAAWPLAGWSVLELSTGIAGAYCTKILADAGADVMKAEPPDGDPLRRWSAGGREIPIDEDGPLFQFLAGSKSSLVADPAGGSGLGRLEDRLAVADVILWSPGSVLAEDPRFTAAALRTRAPDATIVAITPFGLTGPWSGQPANELTLQAWAGGMGNRGDLSRPPVSFGGRPGEWTAGAFAAAAALASRRRPGAPGELIDLSVLECLALTHTPYPVTFFDLASRPYRPVRMRNVPDIHRTADGFVGFMPATGQQWTDFSAMVERPEWAEDLSLYRLEQRVARRAELVGWIDEWCAARTTADIVELASLFAIPVAEVGDGRSMVEFDHLRDRKWFVKNPGAGFLQPDVPYTLGAGAGRREPEPAPRLGDDPGRPAQPRIERPRPDGGEATSASSLPFAGLRVADFTAFWAGPIVGAFLGALGADVIHVESGRRPDGMRYNSARTMEDEGYWEWSPIFHGTNSNKRSLTIDLDSEDGRALAVRLVDSCDVVIENYTPRVMEAFGLSYERLSANHPELIVLRMPAFGLSGPWRDRRGFAQTMEQISGLAWLTGYPDDLPQVPNGPCDPIGGIHATIALQLALEHRDRTRLGMLVEAPQIGAALNIAAEQVIEASAHDVLLTRAGNRGPHGTVQSVVLTADSDDEGRRDRWVAIAVETDEQWGALRRAIGSPSWAADPQLDSADGRQHAHELIDAALGEWAAGHSADSIVSSLAEHGVPVGKVLLAHEQAEMSQHAAREWLETVEHPVTGAIRQPRLPFRLELGPDVMNRRPAPTLGQDNDAILSELGLSWSEIDALTAAGVVGGEPGGGKRF